jgi:hypothetical protein
MDKVKKHIQIDAKVLDWLIKESKRERRNLSNQVEHIIVKYMENQNEQKNKGNRTGFESQSRG